MTEQEILEGNRLIAEFMGLKKYDNGNYEGLYEKGIGIFPEAKLGYYEYWNWLMPVIDKIEYIAEDDGTLKFCVNIHRDWTVIETNDVFPKTISVHSIANDRIASTWNAVVEFIKWHNNQVK